MARALRRVLALAAAVCLSAAGLLVNPDKAFACSCVGITTRTALDRADTVFAGTVLATQVADRWNDRRVDIRFRVNRVYKGTAYAEQLVTTPPDSAACGLRPDVGSAWVIFANDAIHGSGDDAVFRLGTTLCSGNLPTSTVPGVLGRGRPPLPGASDREERATRTDAVVSRVLVASGVATLAIMTFAGAGLALLWGRQRR